MSKKVTFCSVCGIPAPSKPRKAGWLVRGHGNAVCPDCLAEAKLALNAKAQGGRPGAFRHTNDVNVCFNDSIAASDCQVVSADFVGFVEYRFAEGARRVRLV